VCGTVYWRIVPLLLLLLLLLVSPQPRWRLHMQSYRLPLNSFNASAVPQTP
jgi:hypothetical protein